MRALYLQAPCGEVFGRLTVLGCGRNASFWRFRCSCGVDREIRYRTVLNGVTKSCGCIRSETNAARNRTHGWTHLEAFPIWDGMKRRCYDPNVKNFDRYGGRGITVCQRWLDSCEAFAEDMGPRPKGTSLDRIDNEKGYSPDNCRWATPEQQQNNTRRNVFIEVCGERMTVSQAARRLGMPRTTLVKKLSRGVYPNYQSQMREYAA